MFQSKKWLSCFICTQQNQIFCTVKSNWLLTLQVLDLCMNVLAKNQKAVVCVVSLGLYNFLLYQQFCIHYQSPKLCT